MFQLSGLHFQLEGRNKQQNLWGCSHFSHFCTSWILTWVDESRFFFGGVRTFAPSHSGSPRCHMTLQVWKRSVHKPLPVQATVHKGSVHCRPITVDPWHVWKLEFPQTHQPASETLGGSVGSQGAEELRSSNRVGFTDSAEAEKLGALSSEAQTGRGASGGLG